MSARPVTLYDLRFSISSMLHSDHDAENVVPETPSIGFGSIAFLVVADYVGLQGNPFLGNVIVRVPHQVGVVITTGPHTAKDDVACLYA